MTIQEKYAQWMENVKPDEALLSATRRAMREEEAHPSKKKTLDLPALPWKKIASYAAVAAASVLLTVGVLRALPAKKEADLAAGAVMEESAVVTAAEADEAMEYAAADAASEVETTYDNLTIFYVKNGSVVSETRYLPCTVDDLFAQWCDRCGITDVTIEGFEVENHADSLGVRVTFSDNLKEQLGGDSLLISALSQTLSRYLDADGVILVCAGEEL